MRNWLILFGFFSVSLNSVAWADYDNCVASIDQLNMSAAQLDREGFCRCIEREANAHPGIDAELEENNGFPSPDKASDPLKAAVQLCRTVH